MGGDRNSSLEEDSSSEQAWPELSLPTPRKGGLDTELDDGTVSEEHGSVIGEFGDVSHRISSNSLDVKAYQRKKLGAFSQVLRSYDELQRRIGNLEDAKSKILSYNPGAWIEKVGGMQLSDFDVPKTTSLLLIGPKGSGKSSLVNRISRVFEVDKFASERAQVSYNLSTGDGTFFLQEYMIPRCSTSFCLYDTRGLSEVSSEDMEMLKRWMTKGVRHGELVIRDSDSSSVKTRMKYKDRQIGYYSEIRKVNFVIFVVNGLSVLKSMDSSDDVAAAETRYIQIIATTFNCPFLSFKDNKPVIVVTHGDLLSLSERARVRVRLGELLGIDPVKQIFDIPESCDPATELTVVNLLRYSLEHADRNLPGKGRSMVKDFKVSLPAFLFVVIILGIAITAAAHIYGTRGHCARKHSASNSDIHIDWHKIRHLW
ncbi:uncharacterized protein LOC132269175 [Cornus florida]|uniref:uncharacterized protein LOC132269175 n=1 Tax=Cornus florida TaxID=4283 RepID=UPI0028A0C61E|nr:uncharacterized protein LOC132269175 [Cornus florida]